MADDTATTEAIARIAATVTSVCGADPACTRAVFVYGGGTPRADAVLAHLRSALPALPQPIALSVYEKTDGPPVSDGAGGHVHVVNTVTKPIAQATVLVRENGGVLFIGAYQGGSDPFRGEPRWYWSLTVPGEP